MNNYRSEEEIDRVLAEIKKVWLGRRTIRLGQLLIAGLNYEVEYNISELNNLAYEMYLIEDDEFLKRLQPLKKL